MKIHRFEILAWSFLGFILVLINLVNLGGPRLYSDSYQYLSVAENISKGNGISSSIVHFDVQYHAKTIPAPMTIFPPGYSLLTAFFNLTISDFEKAGFLISAFSFVLLIPIFYYGCMLLELPKILIRFLLMLLIINSASWLYATSVSTEALFTTMSLFAVVLFIKAEKTQKASVDNSTHVIWGSIIVGLCFWVRYAGIFLVITVLSYYFLKMVFIKNNKALKDFIFTSVSAFMVIAAFLRNMILTGTFKGGNTKAVSFSLSETLERFFISIFHLLFGNDTVKTDFLPPGALEAFFCVGLSCLLFLLISKIFTLKKTFWDRIKDNTFIFLFLYVGIYATGLFYLGTSTVISFGDPRLFYPILPEALLLLSTFFVHTNLFRVKSSMNKALLIIILLLVICPYSLINVRSVIREKVISPHIAVENRLTGLTHDGESIRSWIDINIPIEATIVADDGQATSYVLKRKTLSLVNSHFSSQLWSENKIKEIMSLFGAHFLILYPNSETTKDLLRHNSFIKDLLDCKSFSWIRMVARNKDVYIFQLNNTVSIQYPCPEDMELHELPIREPNWLS